MTVKEVIEQLNRYKDDDNIEVLFNDEIKGLCRISKVFENIVFLVTDK